MPEFLRCLHCRGFYEAGRPACKWCDYDTPLLDPAGAPRTFPDRDTCRAIQTAEYEQLPPDAHADPMRPPADNLALRCGCLHCGADGHPFEAVEMRWLANEQMWACPCTTCGGRGFHFDVHPTELPWQCDRCDHFFAPPDGRLDHANAVCPRCGGTQISGWFDDPPDDEFLDDDAENDAESDTDADATTPDPLADWKDDEYDDLPFDDDRDEEDDDRPKYDLGITWKEADADDDPRDDAAAYDDADDFFAPRPPANGRQPDDIDFPRDRTERPPWTDPGLGPDDEDDEDFRKKDIPF